MSLGEDFLRSTWIRPEDLPEYERFVDVVKLATRRHPHPVEVLDAYATYAYDGNLADLMDACHTFPKSFDNRRFDGNPLWDAVRACPDANDCRHCGKCARLCPAKAIEMVQNKPKIHRKQCIRCFCCQEFCPKGALEAKRSAIASILTK